MTQGWLLIYDNADSLKLFGGIELVDTVIGEETYDKRPDTLHLLTGKGTEVVLQAEAADAIQRGEASCRKAAAMPDVSVCCLFFRCMFNFFHI